MMQNQAELLKTKFGKAIAEEANPNEIVSIPGLETGLQKRYLSEIWLISLRLEWKRS